MPPGEYHTYSSARLQRKYPISLSQSHKVVPAGPVSRQFINVFQDKLYVSLLLPSMEAPVRGCVLEQRVFLKALRVLVERGKSTTFKSVKAQVVDAFPSNLAVCIRRDASLVSLELHMRPREKKYPLSPSGLHRTVGFQSNSRRRHMQHPALLAGSAARLGSLWPIASLAKIQCADVRGGT